MDEIVRVIFSARFALSSAAFILLSLSISWLSFWLENKLHDAPFNDWMAEHIGIPLLNTLAMILFIAILYPSLFSLEGLPGFYTLLVSETGRMNQMINWVFVLSLLIPMIPVIGPRIEIVLPIQGLVVLGLIANWLGRHLNDPEISLLPSGMDFLWMLILGILGARLAVFLSRQLGELIDMKYHVAHSGAYMYPVFALIFQTPTLVIYARGIIPGQ